MFVPVGTVTEIVAGKLPSPMRLAAACCTMLLCKTSPNCPARVSVAATVPAPPTELREVTEKVVVLVYCGVRMKVSTKNMLITAISAATRISQQLRRRKRRMQNRS